MKNPYILCIYIYIPRTQVTPVLNGKGLVSGGLTFKNKGQLGSWYVNDKSFMSSLWWRGCNPGWGKRGEPKVESFRLHTWKLTCRNLRITKKNAKSFSTIHLHDFWFQDVNFPGCTLQGIWGNIWPPNRGGSGVGKIIDSSCCQTVKVWAVWLFPKMVVPNNHGFSY